jgi:hypothetical protein
MIIETWIFWIYFQSLSHFSYIHILHNIYIYILYVRIYVHMHTCIYVYMYICIYVYMHICIYVFMYICIYLGFLMYHRFSLWFYLWFLYYISRSPWFFGCSEILLYDHIPSSNLYNIPIENYHFVIFCISTSATNGSFCIAILNFQRVYLGIPHLKLSGQS